MLLLNKIIDNIIKKEDISCNNTINLFFLQSLGQTSDVQLYKQSIVDNEYIDIVDIILLDTLYIKAKRIKNILQNFFKICKWKKSVLYSIDTDLYLTKLDSFKNKYKIILLENNTRYKFRLSDIVNYWIVSLINNQGLFSKPLNLKNPHTNLEFSTHNLYNIYFKLLNTGFDLPLCIAAFFKSNMDIKKFSYDFYPMLKERTILNFINSDITYEKWEQILNMLHDYRKDIDYITFTNYVSHRIKVDVCNKLKKPLFLYLKYKFSCNPLIQKDSKIKGKEILKKYLELNPDFGYSRPSEIMRFIPHVDRPRRRIMPPPPPPQVLINPDPIQISLPTSPIEELHPVRPPPPPPPPEASPPPITHVQLALIGALNPFLPRREIPRSPPTITQHRFQHNRQLENSLSLFRR